VQYQVQYTKSDDKDDTRDEPWPKAEFAAARDGEKKKKNEKVQIVKEENWFGPEPEPTA
jgi:hypothetical protein